MSRNVFVGRRKCLRQRISKCWHATSKGCFAEIMKMKTTTMILMLATAAVLGLGWVSRQPKPSSYPEPVRLTIDLSGLAR